MTLLIAGPCLSISSMRVGILFHERAGRELTGFHSILQVGDRNFVEFERFDVGNRRTG